MKRPGRFFASLAAAGLALVAVGIAGPTAQAEDDCDGKWTKNGNVLQFGPVESTFFSGGEWEGLHEEEHSGAWVEYSGWSNVNQAANALAEGDVEGAVTPDDGYPVTAEAGTGQGTTYCSDGTLDDVQDALPVPSNPSADCDYDDEADVKTATPVPGVTVGLLTPDGITGVYDKNTRGHAEIYGWIHPADALEAIVIDGDPEGAVEPDDESYPATVEADTGQGVTYCSNATLEGSQDPQPPL